MIDLKRFRQIKNIGQAEICKLLGIGQSYLSQMEKGDRPINEEKLNILIATYGEEILKYRQNIGNKKNESNVNKCECCKMFETENIKLREEIIELKATIKAYEKVLNIPKNDQDKKVS